MYRWGLGLQANSCTVQGCYFADNVGDGIKVFSSSNLIGGVNSVDRNVCYSNASQGIQLSGNGNMILGNYIGTDPTGTQKFGNDAGGIQIETSSGTTIGSSMPGATRQIISGNGGSGIRFSDPSAVGVIIQANYIGIAGTGTNPLGNEVGINIVQGQTALIGGTNSGFERNYIGGNTSDGIRISDSNNEVKGNWIGIGLAVNAILNGGHGIHIQTKDNNVIGGSESGDGNIISGNNGNGVFVRALTSTTPTGNSIENNLIGIDSGGNRVPNGSHGVEMLNAVSTAVRDNVISGNVSNGIVIARDNPSTTVNQNHIVNVNLIGIDRRGQIVSNGCNGILITNSAGNTIFGNSISGNGKNGLPESVSYRFGRRFGAQKLKTFSLRCSLLGGLGPASITLMNFLSVQVRFTLIWPFWGVGLLGQSP
ncbi:MAG: hypothetical protein GKR87_07205 [Kiritimatiellae bacterium]|nr:hypothetical protein [Kiritimatiellia bacterium]